MSDSNYCKYCHKPDCTCPPDFEDPLSEYKRLRNLAPKLRARIRDLEEENARLGGSTLQTQSGTPLDVKWEIQTAGLRAIGEGGGFSQERIPLANKAESHVTISLPQVLVSVTTPLSKEGGWRESAGVALSCPNRSVTTIRLQIGELIYLKRLLTQLILLEEQMRRQAKDLPGGD